MIISSYFSSAGNYISDSLKSGFDILNDYVVYPEIDKKIEEISDITSKVVTNKIMNKLYGDPDRYGKVRGTDEHVDIYFKQSPILNKLMKSATGFSIDDFINSLPIGLKHIAAPLRTYLESMIAKTIVAQISDLSVKKSTTTALMAASNYSKDEIKKYVKEYFPEKKGKIDEALTDIIDFEEIEKSHDKTVDLISILESSKDDNAITLIDVIDSYKAKVQMKINHSLREALIEGIAEACEIITEKSVNKTLDTTEQYNAVLAGIFGVAGAVPAAFAAGSLAYASNKIKPSISDFAKNKAKENVRYMANQFVPMDIMPVDYEAMGPVSLEKVSIEYGDIATFELIDTDNDNSSSLQQESFLMSDDTYEMDFELMDYKQPTFTRWSEEKFKTTKNRLTEVLNALREKFQYNQSNTNSEIPTIMQNWFVDNDFDKLNTIRKAYVEAESKINELDTKLLGICEYAYGIRDDVNEVYPENFSAGLDICIKSIDRILLESEGNIKAAHKVAAENIVVDNETRRKNLVNPSKQRLDKLSSNIKSYAEEIKKAIKEVELENINQKEISSSKKIKK